MKIKNFILLFFIVSFSALINSCSNDEDSQFDDTAPKINQVKYSKSNAKSSSITTFSMSSARGNNFGNFLNSETFSRHESYFNQLGDMNLDEIQYQQIIIDNISYDLFIVPILKNGFLMGKLEVLDLKDTPFLPNNDKYALNYADLSKYDLTSDTGKIDLYDLNFDNYLHTKIEVLNGVYVSYNGAGLSQGLKEKYASIANPNKTENLRVRNVSCDGNGNGDVTFSECYKCFSVAIQMNSTSTAICEAYHAAGLPWWGSCMSSTAAACVIISSIR